ncbi:hypothetical protein RIF29_30096 [Crotalaria pallida]|uniref:Uncharacterized protein n=1 Tax=Crotalaria pallida TaxID=3830 RepID=A0AAN9HWG5_CROPI
MKSGANQYPSTKSPSISNDYNSEGDNNYDNEEESHHSKKKANVRKGVNKRKARENIQLAFANAMTNFGENAKKKLKFLEKMSTSNVAMSNAVQKQVEQSMDRASFVKALTLLKEDLLWRDEILKLSDEQKKDWILSLA